MNIRSLLLTLTLLTSTLPAYITLPTYFILPHYPAPFTLYNSPKRPTFRPVPSIVLQNRNDNFYSSMNNLLEQYNKMPRYGPTNTNYMLGNRNTILGMYNSLTGHDNLLVGYMNVV